MSEPKPYLYQNLQCELESTGMGYCRLCLPASETHCGANGRIFTSVAYTLIEASMIEAAKTMLQGRKGMLTDIEVRYLNPMNQGNIYCETKVLHISKLHAVLETNIVNDDSVVCVRASGSFYLR